MKVALSFFTEFLGKLTFPKNLPRSYRLFELGSTTISGISTALGLSVAIVAVGGRALILTNSLSFAEALNFFGQAAYLTSFLLDWPLCQEAEFPANLKGKSKG